MSSVASLSTSSSSSHAQAMFEDYVKIASSRGLVLPETPISANRQPVAASASKSQLWNMTHMPSGSALLKNRSSGKSSSKSRQKKSDTQKSIAASNDAAYPWLRNISDRSQVFNCVETIPAVILYTSSTVIPVFGAASFTFSQVGDAASLASVFDQYMIRLIEVLIEPLVTEVTGPTNDVGEYTSVVDIDDANTPSSYPDLCSYSSAVQSRGTLTHYHRWVPSVAVAAYSGAFTSFAAETNMWLDCASPSIQHYGLKAGSLTSTVAQAYTYQVKLHLSFRGRH